jgi:outer membrane immunogenic protein
MNRTIRGLISAAGFAGFAQTALAADLDYMRGSELFSPAPAAYFNWSGFYFGASGGGGVADVDFGARARQILNTLASGAVPVANAAAVAGMVPDLSTDDRGFGTYGVFIGYNTQWESAILGIEGNYHHTTLAASGTASATGITVSPGPNPGPDPIGLNPITWNSTMSMSSKIELKDYGTVRGRLGWAFGNFMPYATLGVAIGRMDTTNSARLQYTGTFPGGIPAGAGDVRLDEIQRGEVKVGYEFALGVDWMIMAGLFLRAEYEFVEFTNLGDRKLTLNTARAGLGYKF